MSDAPIKIGVLALQGSFREHMALLRQIPGVEAVEIRKKEELLGCTGLIIPGTRIPIPFPYPTNQSWRITTF